jgi:serine/threonine protein kinase
VFARSVNKKANISAAGPQGSGSLPFLPSQRVGVAKPTMRLAEARTVANLDHPHIVPVFDVGSTEACLCYVVSKYIDGTDLATRLKQSRLPIHEAVDVVARC